MKQGRLFSEAGLTAKPERRASTAGESTRAYFAEPAFCYIPASFQCSMTARVFNELALASPRFRWQARVPVRYRDMFSNARNIPVASCHFNYHLQGARGII